MTCNFAGRTGRALCFRASRVPEQRPAAEMAADSLPRRIVKETQRLMSEPGTISQRPMPPRRNIWLTHSAAPGISATPYEDNLRYFNVIIAGPSGSPYEGIYNRDELRLVADVS